MVNIPDWILKHISKIRYIQFKAGDSYSSLKKTISMNILAYTQFPEHHDYHSKYVLFDRKHEHELEEILELHFFELLKAVKEKQTDKKHLWLKLINAESQEDLDKLLETSNEDFVQKGVEAVNDMNADANFRIIVQMREDALRERDSMLYEAKQEGIEEGKAQGLEEGKVEEQRKAVEILLALGHSKEEIRKHYPNYQFPVAD